MNIDLVKKKEIICDSINHCTHILELDYLREDYSKKTENVIYPLKYSIKESEIKLNDSYDEISTIGHLLFYNYPQYKEEGVSLIINEGMIQHSDNYIKTSLEDLNISFLKIPEPLIIDSLRTINKKMCIQKTIEIIKSNICIVQNLGIGKSHLWITYIKLYKDILDQICSINLNENESEDIVNLTKDISILLLIVESENSQIEFNKTKKEIKNLSIKNNENIALFDLIDCIRVNLNENDDGKWLYDCASKFSVKMYMNGNIISIHSEEPNILLELYAKIYLINSKSVTLVMKDKYKNNENMKTFSHLIDCESSKWAYVFNAIYGSSNNYNENTDNIVKNIILFSEKYDIPVKFLLRDRKNTLIEYKDITLNN